MKSVKVFEVIDWLEKDVRLKQYSVGDIKRLIEIAEIEITGDKELLDKKIEEFKNRFSVEPNIWMDIH